MYGINTVTFSPDMPPHPLSYKATTNVSNSYYMKRESWNFLYHCTINIQCSNIIDGDRYLLTG